LATWTCWEPNALDNLDDQYVNDIGHDATGRFIPYWNRLDGPIDVVPLAGYTDQIQRDASNVAYKSGEATIFQPTEYQSSGMSLHPTVA
jgi:methyl-accepting chemotaxis protein